MVPLADDDASSSRRNVLCSSKSGVSPFVPPPSTAHYPATTSRCIQSSNTVGSIEGFTSMAYWLAPKTLGR